MTLNGIPISEDSCIGDSLQYINSAYVTLSARVLVTTGNLPPAFVPSFIGQEYLDIATNKFYKAVGTTHPTDWVVLN